MQTRSYSAPKLNSLETLSVNLFRRLKSAGGGGGRTEGRTETTEPDFPPLSSFMHAKCNTKWISNNHVGMVIQVYSYYQSSRNDKRNEHQIFWSDLDV